MLELFWESAWKVAVWGFVLGAGLPALFALGVRSTVLANGVGGDIRTADGSPAANSSAPSGFSRATGIVCFLVVVVAVLLGLTLIVATGFGKEVTFDNVIPTLQPKD
jgi:hypothetical protein